MTNTTSNTYATTLSNGHSQKCAGKLQNVKNNHKKVKHKTAI